MTQKRWLDLEILASSGWNNVLFSDYWFDKDTKWDCWFHDIWNAQVAILFALRLCEIATNVQSQFAEGHTSKLLSLPVFSMGVVLIFGGTQMNRYLSKPCTNHCRWVQALSYVSAATPCHTFHNLIFVAGPSSIGNLWLDEIVGSSEREVQNLITVKSFICAFLMHFWLLIKQKEKKIPFVCCSSPASKRLFDPVQNADP